MFTFIKAKALTNSFLHSHSTSCCQSCTHLPQLPSEGSTWHQVLSTFEEALEGLQSGRRAEKQTPWKSTTSPCNPVLFLPQHARVTAATTWLWFFVCLKHRFRHQKIYASALRKDLEHHELTHWESQLHQPAAHWSSATDKTRPTTLRLCSPQLPPCHCQQF